MKDFQKTLKELRELSTISEETKTLLEKMTGKELVDYESIDALVGALMTHYNGELKKKAQTSHNHDERYYTEGEIDNKLETKLNKSGGTITGSLTVTGNTVTNGSINCKSLIINGWTVTITD